MSVTNTQVCVCVCVCVCVLSRHLMVTGKTTDKTSLLSTSLTAITSAFIRQYIHAHTHTHSSNNQIHTLAPRWMCSQCPDEHTLTVCADRDNSAWEWTHLGIRLQIEDTQIPVCVPTADNIHGRPDNIKFYVLFRFALCSFPVQQTHLSLNFCYDSVILIVYWRRVWPE